MTLYICIQRGRRYPAIFARVLDLPKAHTPGMGSVLIRQVENGSHAHVESIPSRFRVDSESGAARPA